MSGNGGRYTRAHLPVALAYCEPQPDSRSARKREAAIKGMSRGEKEALVAASQRRKRTRAKRTGRRKDAGEQPAALEPKSRRPGR
jgi:predicted GIY-YIG superfamily endonuclease